MQKILHRSADRGVGDHGWLHSRFSFSFADWYDPSRVGFGALRVINDDEIAGGAGFGAHQHHDMEIITIVTEGAVAHKDSIGNEGTVPAGDVQVMSAGTGVIHAEFNASKTEPLKLFQIWIEPNKQNVEPRYDQRSFAHSNTPGLTTLVGPMNSEFLGIHQDAYISRAVIGAGASLTYNLHTPTNCVYIFVVEGGASIDGDELGARDAMGISETETVKFIATVPTIALIIEVPKLFTNFI